MTTDHEYGAVTRSLQQLSDRFGVRNHRIRVPFPLQGTQDVLQAVRDQWPQERVRLAIFDHITSATGLVWPVAQLTELAHEHGAQVLIDGAHAPGQVPLDLGSLGADYWVGNCHKWLFAPKGCAVLSVARERRAALHPLVVSHGYGQGLTEEFDWVGTRDPTPWLAAEAALDFVRQQGGLDRIRAHNVALRRSGAQILEREVGLGASAPPSMLAALETRPLPIELGTDPPRAVPSDVGAARGRGRRGTLCRAIVGTDLGPDLQHGGGLRAAGGRAAGAAGRPRVMPRAVPPMGGDYPSSPAPSGSSPS